MDRDVAPPATVLALGPIAVHRDEQVLPVAGAQQAAVLALLVDRLGRPVSADRLVDEAWGGDPPESAGAALRVHLAKIRALLSDGYTNPVPHDAGGYRLDPALVGSDVDRFASLVAHARSCGPEVALAAYDEALGLWRGAPYAGVREMPSLRAAVDRLTELRLDVEEERVEALLALGRHAEARSEVATLVRAEPLRERRTRQLMVALYRSGRHAEALAAYGRLRDVLIEELALDPAPETRRLEAAILRQEPGLAPTDDDTGEWSTRSVEGLALPAETSGGGPLLHELVRRRLEPLDDLEHRLVELVAVLDDLADDDVLATVHEVDARSVAAAVHRCVGAGVLAQTERPRMLARAAWRDGVLSQLPTEARADLHEAAARGLVTARPGSAVARVVAARHLVAAAGLRRSADEATGFAVVEAVDACLATDQVAVAQSLCEEALCLPGVPIAVAVDLTTRLVTALSRLGQVGLADEVFRKGVAAARELGDPQRLALLVLARDWLVRTVLGDDSQLLLLEEVLGVLGDQPSALRVRVSAALVLESAVPGRSRPADALAATLEAEARFLGDHDSLWDALYARHTSLRVEPDVAARQRIGAELWERSRSDRDPERLALAALARVHDAFATGDHAETDTIMDVLEEVTTTARYPRLQWHHALMRSVVCLDRGRLEDSDRWADEAVVIGASVGHPDALGAAAVHAMQVHFHRGTLAEFFPTIEEFAASIPDNILVPATRGLALAQAGRREDAILIVRRLVDRLLSEPRDEFTQLAAAMCAETMVVCGDLAAADQVREILAPFAGQFVVFGQVTATWGPVERLLGLLASAEGRHGAATAYLDAAAALAERSGLDLWLDRCRADALVVRSRAGGA